MFFNFLLNSRCKLQLFAIQAIEYGLLAILMALIASSADDFQFNELAVEHMRVCLSAPTALDGLLGQENIAHPKGSAVLQVFVVVCVSCFRASTEVLTNQFSLGRLALFPIC